MTDVSEKVQPLPTTGRGTLANYVAPLDYASSFVVGAIAVPSVGGPTLNAVWDMLSDQKSILKLTADTHIDLPINIERVDGEVFYLEIVQDSIGGHKLSWGSPFDWDQRGEPILSKGPGERTILQFFCTELHLFGGVFYQTPAGDYQPISTI